MLCDDLKQQLDDYLAGNLSEPATSAVSAHLQQCDHCRHHYLQMQKMLFALRAMPVASPLNGYAERVMDFLPHRHTRPATERHHVRWYAAGFATALLVVLVALFVIRPPAGLPGQKTAMLNLYVSPQGTQPVNLVFHSPKQISHATLRIELPSGIEIKGYARQRVLQWQTSLQRGSNRLVLPLQLTGHTGGILTARLSHAGHSRVFKVHLITRGSSSQLRTANQTV